MATTGVASETIAGRTRAVTSSDVSSGAPTRSRLWQIPDAIAEHNRRKYVAIAMSCHFAWVIHALLTVLTGALGLTTLVVVASEGGLVALWALVENRRGHHSRAIGLLASEVIANVSIAVALVGPGLGLHYYFWAIACLVTITPSLPARRAAAMGLSLILLFAMLEVGFAQTLPPAALRPWAAPLQFFNALVAGVPVVLGIMRIRGIFETQERRLRDLATTDELTGLFNRRYTKEYLQHRVSGIQRTGGDLCVVLGDLDHFKRINDTFGHEVGDDVLRGVAACFHTRLRSSDIASRWGGEEFLLVLNGSGLEQTRSVIEALGHELSRSVRIDGSAQEVTMSFGIARVRPGESPEAVLRRADMNLYEAKRTGRNRVVG